MEKTLATCAAAVALTWVGRGLAHPVTVDGQANEWRPAGSGAPADNLGRFQRTPALSGEYLWRDAAADTRTDFATPESIADLIALHVTGDATNLYLFGLLGTGAASGVSPVQLQVAIDVDRVSGSGEEFFASFAETRTSQSARWEFLARTKFGTAPNTGELLGAGFAAVGALTTVQAGANVEMAVPWSMLGLGGPPSAPLRFTVTTYRSELASDLVLDVGGLPDALDAVTDYGDPQGAGPFPNTFAELTGPDDTIDYFFDVWFDSAGEVRTPVVITRFASNASLAQGEEWVRLRNVTAATLSLDGHHLGDAELPGLNEGMRTFPAGITVLAGATATVARNGVAYQAAFAAAPEAEFGGGGAAPDMTSYAPWATAPFGLANAGDQILLLDPRHTILDAVTFGSGAFPSTQSMLPALASSEVASRDASDTDTDDCDADFRIVLCEITADCAICEICEDFTCVQAPTATPCDDSLLCTENDACAGAVCAGAPKDCTSFDTACMVGGCNSSSGACEASSRVDGTLCDDGVPCTETDECSGGVCDGTPKDCTSLSDDCNDGTCNAASGVCQAQPKPGGTTCDDGSLCTSGDICTGGACGGTATDCTSLDTACNVGLCNAADGLCGAQARPPGTSCDDADPCTETDVCAAGACAGAVKDCTSLDDACHTGTCNALGGSCEAIARTNGTTCNDTNACTENDQCTSGACAGTPVAGGTACSDECNTGMCVAATGMCDKSPLANGTVCTGGTCTAGVCTTPEGGTDGGAGADGAAGAAGADGGAGGSGGAAAEAGASGSAGQGADSGSSGGGASGSSSASGAAGSGVAGSAATGGGSSGSGAIVPRPADESGGCGCRVEARSTRMAPLALALALALGRRRRRSALSPGRGSVPPPRYSLRSLRAFAILAHALSALRRPAR